MNWKPTALVSGATLVATWLASAPSVRSPETAAVAPMHQGAQSAAAAAEIVQEADRLRARLTTTNAYQQPARNPFRFGERLRPATPAPPVAPPSVAAQPTAPVVPTLLIALSGIAEDDGTGALIRTAVISTPTDVVLVKEGDLVTGQYWVTAISGDSVDLIHASDGTVVRLRLKP